MVQSTVQSPAFTVTPVLYIHCTGKYYSLDWTWILDWTPECHCSAKEARGPMPCPLEAETLNHELVSIVPGLQLNALVDLGESFYRSQSSEEPPPPFAKKTGCGCAWWQLTTTITPPPPPLKCTYCTGEGNTYLDVY